MKKKILLIVLFTIGIFCCFGANVYAAEEYNMEPLGYTINIPKNGLASEKVYNSKPIYSLNFLQQIKSNGSIVRRVNRTSVYTASKTSVTACSKEIATSYGITSTANAILDDVAIGIGHGFKTNLGKEISQYVFNNFSYYSYLYEKYNIFLPQQAQDTTYLTQNNCYDSYFILELDKLAHADYTAYANFFDNYGTHILTDINMGGRFEAMNAIYSTQYNLSKSEQAAFDEFFGASVSDYVKSGTTIELDLSKKSTLYSKIDENYLKAQTYGGNPLLVNYGQNNAGMSYEEWKNSIVSGNCAFVSVHNSGVRPIWDLLPDNYNFLRSRFITYYNQYVKNSDDTKEISITSLENGLIKNLSLTEGEITLSGSDREANASQEVSLSTPNFYGMSAYRNAGYTEVSIEIDFDYRRKNMGYQWFIINAKEPKGNVTTYELFSKKFENKLDTQHASIKTTINLSNFIEEGFYINHCTSGSGDNTCYYSNLVISLIFTK